MVVIESLSFEQHDVLRVWFRRWISGLQDSGGPSPFVSRYSGYLGKDISDGKLTDWALHRVALVAQFLLRYGVTPDRYAPLHPDDSWVSRDACPPCSIGMCTYPPHRRTAPDLGHVSVGSGAGGSGGPAGGSRARAGQLPNASLAGICMRAALPEGEQGE